MIRHLKIAGNIRLYEYETDIVRRRKYGDVLVQFNLSMLAFEIHINDREPLVVAAENLAVISLSYGVGVKNPDYILVAGADDSFYYTWFDDKVRAGDNVFVRVVNVTKSNVSYPQTATERNRDQMKQEFERLKQELKDKHLL